MKVGRRTRTAVLAAAILSCAACGSAGGASPVDIGAEAAPAGMAGPTAPPSTTPPSTLPAKPFSTETKARIAREGTTIASDPEAASAAPISYERAKRIALENFGIIQGREPDEAEFGLVTNSKAGRVAGDASDPRQAGARVTRTIVNRSMWLLLYRDVETPMSVPYPTTPEEVRWFEDNKPFYNITDFLVYVDANSGTIPRAETLVE